MTGSIIPRVSPDAAPSLQEGREGAQLQPKASKLLPLAPEFAYTQRLTCAALPPLDARRQLTMFWMGLPQHTRLLRSSWVEMGSSADSSHMQKGSSSADSSHRGEMGSSADSSHMQKGSSADSSHRGHPQTPRTCRRGHPPTPLTCKRRSHPPAPHICPRVSSCRGHMSSCLGFSRVPVHFPHMCLCSFLTSAPESVRAEDT